MLGGLTMGTVSVFGSEIALLAMLGTWMSILAGLLLAHITIVETQTALQKQLLNVAGLPMELTANPQLLDAFCDISKSLDNLANQSNPILVEFAQRKLTSITDQMQAFVRGQMVFASTEGWRTVYEQILRCKSVKSYYSVAWFKSEEYWQDEPGRKSLALNLELLRQGLQIERVIVIRDRLWPTQSALPAACVLEWIAVQVKYGARISIVRESEISSEPDLCCDFGIYDQSAVGVQEIDDRCRTMAFTLYFDPQDIAEAIERWKRLKLYARSYDLANNSVDI